MVGASQDTTCSQTSAAHGLQSEHRNTAGNSTSLVTFFPASLLVNMQAGWENNGACEKDRLAVLEAFAHRVVFDSYQWYLDYMSK